MPEPAPLDGPTVSIRLARALSAGKTDAATVAKQISAAPPPKDPNLPRTVGRYRILDRLGRGGMGVVYGAWDDRLQRPVALKMLRAAAADPDDLARFQREVRIAASLKHPGIVAVHEVGSDGADPFFTMDIVDGVPLDIWCAKQALGRDARVDLVSKVAQAVHHAHTRGVLHRDLKPGNILVREDGQPVILDFGLAKPTAEAESTFNTMTGTAMGTPAYMSPEQAGGRVHEVDTRTDVYALGVILYQLVTGRLPFEGKDPMEICRKVVEEEVPRPSTRGLRLPADLETVILKALEKDPARRYPSALHLDEELRRYLTGEPIFARKASILYRIRRRVGRNPVVSSLAAALVLSILGGGVWIVRESAARLRANESLLESAREREQAIARLETTNRAYDLLEEARMAEDGGASDEETLRLFEAARAAQPDHVPTLFAVAIHFASRGRMADAMPYLEEVVRLDPGHSQAHILLSNHLWNTDRHDEAARHARLAAAHGEQWASLYVEAVEHRMNSRPGEALACALRLLELRPRFPSVQILCAEVLLQMSRPDEALQYLDRVPIDTPEMRAAHAYLCALAWHRKGDLPKALELIDLAISINPRNPEVHRARAVILIACRRFDDALVALEHAIEFRPDFLGAMVQKAGLLRQIGRLPQALDAIESARRVAPDDDDVNVEYAAIVGALRRFEEALAILDRIETRSPGLPVAVALRGFVLMDAGRTDEARGLLLSFLRDHPTDDQAPRVRAALDSLPPVPPPGDR